MTDEPYSRRRLVILGVLGILVPGMLNYYFHELAPKSGACRVPLAGAAFGQPCLGLAGDAIFAVGYLLAAYLIWRGWIRHIDFQP